MTRQIRSSAAAGPSTRDYFFTSSRIGFATWTEDDADLAASIWGDAEVTKLIGGPFTPEQVQARLATEISNRRRHGFQYWPLFRLDTGELVGCCGLRPRDGAAGVAEFGFQLRRAAWGQGFASEAAAAVIGFASTHGLSTLIAGHHPQNHVSRHVLQRLGFIYTHHEHYAPTGRWSPAIDCKSACRRRRARGPVTRIARALTGLGGRMRQSRLASARVS